MPEDKANTFEAGKIILNYKPKLESKEKDQEGYNEYNIYNLQINLVPSPLRPTASLSKPF